jgi:hypothetical protein
MHLTQYAFWCVKCRIRILVVAILGVSNVEVMLLLQFLVVQAAPLGPVTIEFRIGRRLKVVVLVLPLVVVRGISNCIGSSIDKCIYIYIYTYIYIRTLSAAI